MPNIQDVARRAGVSPITVSRVINHSRYISQKTVEKVEAAIAELGYVPNTLARSLRSKRTQTLALVLTDITNPFFTTLARGVEDTASSAGFNVIFCNTDESEAKEQRYLQLLLQKQVDGMLLVPARSRPDPVLTVRKQGTPVVVLDRCVPGVEADVVRCDSEDGAYRLVRLLLDLGHRRIAALTGHTDVSTAEDRAAGYRRALAEAGLAGEETVLYGAFNQESGYAMARQALSLRPAPTGIFAANNFIAIGALKALQEQGLSVPQDISMVAFDDLPPGLITFSFMTVASQPAYEMGRVGTSLLLGRLSSAEPAPYQEIVLPIEIITRQSAGQAK
ncbi:MAG TPA: LacI family DNA-binding transcriptional regulator [Anaerolineales bacterium]